MRIEDFKRWHWIVIGTVVGLLLAYTQLHSDWRGSDDRRALAQKNFEQLLSLKAYDGRPLLKDIRVYQHDDGLHFVSLSKLPGLAGGKYGPYKFIAQTPYVPLDKSIPPTPDMTVLDYLAKVSERHEHVSYAHVWWAAPKWVWTLWTGGSILLIGGVWPTVLGLLIGAGFGRPRRKEEEEYDLDRFKGEPEEEKKPAVVTAAQHDQLAALEAELERKLAGSESAAPESDTATSGSPGQIPIKKLTGGPVAGPAAEEKPQDPKDYRGEFYPVARKR